MKNYNNKKIILIPTIILLLVTISCNLPTIGSRFEDQADLDITNSIPFGQSGQLNDANNLNDREYISFQTTEAELTQILNQELQNNPDLGITQAEVHLRNGVIQITGQVNRSGLKLPLEMNILLLIDDQSHLSYTITSANIGPFPLPDYSVDQAMSQIEKTIINNTNLNRDNITITQIKIENGILSIDGYLQN